MDMHRMSLPDLKHTKGKCLGQRIEYVHGRQELVHLKTHDRQVTHLMPPYLGASYVRARTTCRPLLSTGFQRPSKG